MTKFVKRVLTSSAKLSEKLAVKSCNATSAFDSYQPVRPEAVSKLAEAQKNK